MGCPHFFKKAGGLNQEEYLTLPLLDRPGFFHFFGKKELSEDAVNLFSKGRFVRLLQVHGDGIVQSPTATEGRPTGDALITDQPGTFLTIFTADCLPVIIIDPNRRAIGISHAGWKGTLLRIVAKTVSAMTQAYGSDPSSLLIGMGPRIGPCCFEVDQDVWGQIESNLDYKEGVLVRKQGGKGWISLAQLNRIQLLSAGIKPENIADTELCTRCHPNLFHSYRRNKIKGQNMVNGVGMGITPSGG